MHPYNEKHCEGPGYLIATGAPNRITLGEANRIAAGAAKRIAPEDAGEGPGAGQRITEDHKPHGSSRSLTAGVVTKSSLRY